MTSNRIGKPITLIFFGNGEEIAAKELAVSMRDGTRVVMIRQATRYIYDDEMCKETIIMPGVQDIERKAIKDLIPFATDLLEKEEVKEVSYESQEVTEHQDRRGKRSRANK